MLSRLNVLLAALVLTRLALPGTPDPRPTVPVAVDEARPNVVYVMSDELAYFELGHMGNPYIRTPNIDRFAEEGMRFTRAYAGS